MRGGRHWKVVVALILFLIGLNARPGAAAPAPEAGAAPALQGTLVAMVSPSACPSGGCAAGQRLNMRFDFEPEGYDAAQAQNVKMCIYAPSGWGVNPASVTVDATGELTGKPYQAAGDDCPQDTAKPAGYDLIFERVAQLDANTLIDSLGFGFTLGPAAGGNGRILARLFARDSAGAWSPAPVQQVTSLPTITVTAAADRSFVANDAAVCGTASPCYVNSGNDLENGIGTGLKDAVDAAPAGATLYVLGSYTIKSNTVLVNKKLTITGPGNTNITYTGPGGCDKAMLRLTGEVALREILINDGICTNPNRNLIEVNSPAPVVIERTNMTSGADAITLFDNTGSLLVRFNDIHGNSGYALKGLGVTNKGPLTVVANNLDRNRAEQAIDCADGATDPLAYRVANHNYWGSSSPSSTNSHCTIEASKRLGLAIALATDKTGVRAQLVEVGTGKIYSEELDSKIAYARTNTGENFWLFLIDHGYATAGGPPFSFDRGIQSPSPCSNYWDVFLQDTDNEPPSGALELYLKYDRTNACLATINSNQYCDQTTTVSKIPLYWYDPRNATGQWITTGSKLDSNTDGQVTSCDTTTNEVKVTIDSSGRPNLGTDLSYVPLMVGVPVINTFQPRASTQAITVTWSTNNEPDVVGFYVLRGQSDGAINPISDLIAHTGTALAGRSYSFLDSGRVNGVDYRYRLQVLRADGTSIYSSIVSISANPATITPTATRAFTATARPTNTPIPTNIFTRVPTRIPTRAATARPTSSVFPTALQLATRRPTLNVLTPGAAQTMTVWALTPQLAMGTRTGTLTGQGGATGAGGYPVPDDGTPAAGGGTAVAVVGSGTPSPTVSPTPSFTPVRIPGDISAAGNAVSSGPSPWLSLLLGLLAGLATTGGIGAAWYFLRLRKV